MTKVPGDRSQLVPQKKTNASNKTYQAILCYIRKKPNLE